MASATAPPLSSATAHRNLAGSHAAGAGTVVAPSLHPAAEADVDEERDAIGGGRDEGRSTSVLNADCWLLLAARFVRQFSYSWLAVGLILYLATVGFSQFQIGVLFTMTLLGDLLVTFWLSTSADALGRRNTLLAASLLKVFAGCAYAFLHSFPLLLVAGFLGIVSPTGGEIGPFLAIEQASLTESVTRKEDITRVFAWYQLIGYFGQAMGALASGFTMSSLQTHHGWEALDAYRFIIVGYALFGLVKFCLYWFVSSDIEPLHTREVGDGTWMSKFGLHRAESRRIVFKLSCLFILDAYAGGFAMQSIISYWFATEWSFSEHTLGLLLMGANVFSGISALAASPLVARFGAINTMVFSHLPSNILLLLVPFMPSATSAVVVLLLRFTISQMDVPARNTYIAHSVAPDERSAAGGITSIVRSVGLSLSPLLAGYLLSHPDNKLLFGLPFVVAGALKCVYDVLLYWAFTQKAEPETGAAQASYARVGQSESDRESTHIIDKNLYDEEADFDKIKAGK